MEITAQELQKLNKDSYQLIDIRNEEEAAYGEMAGALRIPAEEIMQAVSGLDCTKKLVICCARGQISVDVAEALREKGIDAVSLTGGYGAWLVAQMKAEMGAAESGEDFARQAEESIRKKFRRTIWCKFTKAINEYELVKEGDRIAVCISGGKDSMLLAKLMQELQRHSKVHFETAFLVMDPGYNELNRRKIEQNAALLNVPIQIFETDVFNVANSSEHNPCYLCARMRRGYLYSKAKELGCNKIALGHHFNDVIETTVMAMFYGAQLQAMLPKLHSSNFEGMELIRPMYCIHEEDIIRWKNAHGLEFIQCACRFTENCAASEDGSGNSKRREVKLLLKRLKKDNPDIEKSVFNSIHSVCLDTMPGWKTKGETHSFLEHYDRE